MSEFFKLSQKKHYLGSKLAPFMSDDEISQMIEKCVGDGCEISAVDNEPKNELFSPCASSIYRTKNADLRAVVKSDKNSAEICSILPSFEIGLVYKGEIECVHVWSDGSQGQVELETDGYTMIFYDESFIKNRAFYESGEVKARIYALGFEGCFVKDEVLEITANEVYVKSGLAKEVGEVMSIHTGKMTSWMPLDDDDDRDIDEVSFRGEVMGVRQMRLELFDKDAFVFTLRVFDESDDENNLEVIFTNESWGEKLPKKGDFISVYACLCGEILK